MTTVFFLLTYQDPPQISRLIGRLREGGDIFCLIHHDDRLCQLDLPPSSDTHVLSSPIPISWGHISWVDAVIKGFRWLDEHRIDYEWVLLLSGHDYPAQPLAQIERSLEESTVDAWMHFVEISPDRAEQADHWQKNCYDRYFRLWRPGRRGPYISLPRHHPYREGARCYAGVNWMNLSHRAVSQILEPTPFAARVHRYLARSPVPEESYFQTILGNADLAIANDSRRFIRWDRQPHPSTLTTSDVPAIVASDAFFARKFDRRLDPAVFDLLDEHTGKLTQ